MDRGIFFNSLNTVMTNIRMTLKSMSLPSKLDGSSQLAVK